MLARAAAPSLRVALRSSPRQVRTIYTTKPHTAYNNFPFSYANKRSFAVKCAGTLGTLFLVPFIASAYQLHKSGAI